MSDRPARRALAVVVVVALVVPLLAPYPVLPLATAQSAGPVDAAPADSSRRLGPAGTVASVGVAPSVPAPGRETVPSRTRRVLAGANTGGVGGGPGTDGAVAGSNSSRRVEGGAAADGRRVHLVTGETVAVYGHAGNRSYEAVSGGPVNVLSVNDRTYLLPAGVDLGTYDRSLFAVEALLAARSDGTGLPVLLETNGTTRPAWTNASTTTTATNGTTRPAGTNASTSTLEEDASSASVDTDASATIDYRGLRNVRRLPSAGVIAAELDPATAEGTIASLVADGRVEGLTLDRRVERVPAAGTVRRGTGYRGNLTGEGVTVAVLDTGIDATHPALADAVVGEVDFVEGDQNAGGSGGSGGDGDRGVNNSERRRGGNDTVVAPDENGHGTLVAGVLAGNGSGDRAGVAPGADLLDVRVMDNRGTGRASTIVEGIEYAVERDVDVVLLSVGTSIDGGDAIAQSVAWAADRGVVVVAAAGNAGGPRSIGAPGRPPEAITVGATDARGRVAAYSSRGPTLDGHLKPDLVAPGGGIVGPRSSNSARIAVDDAGRYTRMSGTSAATPQVAGAAALLLEAEPNATASEIESRLGSAARPVDGASAFAQGSGELDVAGAVDPDVVVDDPAVDIGLLQSDRTVNRSITLTNRDDRRHVLSFDVRVENVDLGVDADGTVALNRSTLTLAPGERANLTLSVDGDAPSGAYAGEVRYAVAGESRSVALGFVRGGAVTVEKRAFSGSGGVDGEPLWVLNEEGTHDQLLEFEDGTASFVAGGGTYILWSWGTDEPSGTLAFLSERRTFDDPTRVVLDERETVPVGVDADPIAERYGPLTNRSVKVSLSTPYGDGRTRLSVSKLDTDRRLVRVSRDPGLTVATTYLLTTEPRGSAEMDVSDVFQLAHGVEGVRGPSVAEARLDRLATAEQRLHRATVDETYRVQDRTTVRGVWNQVDRQWFDLGRRVVQRVHRFPASATFRRSFRGDGWDAHRVGPDGTGGGRTADVLAHPMHGLFETLDVEDGTVTASATPFSDGAGTRFDPAGDHRLSVAVDGEVRREGRVRDGDRRFDGIEIEPGQSLTVRVVGDRSGGFLSTRTLTEVVVPAYDRASERPAVPVNRPPVVTNVSILRADDANAAGPGEVTAVFEVDTVGPIVAPTVWYAAGDPAAPPWENASGWSKAAVESDDDRLLANFTVAGSAETVSLAASVRDFRRHRARTMTLDAFHVGEAPDTSTATLAGRLLAPDGTAAVNDTVVVDPVDGGRTRYLPTGTDGRFAADLPKDRRYDLTYVRGGPWTASDPTGDGRPAWLPLRRVRLDRDVDLAVRTLPAARNVTVTVTDERGEPVRGVPVRVRVQAGNVSATEVLQTGPDGLARRHGIERPGVHLAGPVEVTVDPPETELYPEQSHRRTVGRTDPPAVNVTLETAPPTARLTAFGRFEPGGVVFLDAQDSEAPAGVAAYRWDLDGDGVADRVTGDPVIRYVPDEGSLRPTVTVVDEAGKTARASLALRLRTNRTAAGAADG